MNELHLLVTVGANIRRIRTGRNLSQNDLAIMCNFEKASMSRIEAGKTNVTLLTLQKISKALNVNITDLVEQ
ncbi:MAG TPA: helix-turn-helix transcriptional regulator [Chitinophagaceae bacterium]|nr:helix-turn-helix transcriptional regulator [Chitinophagaceae bacterium]